MSTYPLCWGSFVTTSPKLTKFNTSAIGTRTSNRIRSTRVTLCNFWTTPIKATLKQRTLSWVSGIAKGRYRAHCNGCATKFFTLGRGDPEIRTSSSIVISRLRFSPGFKTACKILPRGCRQTIEKRGTLKRLTHNLMNPLLQLAPPRRPPRVLQFLYRVRTRAAFRRTS